MLRLLSIPFRAHASLAARALRDFRATLALAIAVALLSAACMGGGGGGNDSYRPRPTLPASPAAVATGTLTATLQPTPIEAPIDLRIAYINLLSPVPLDAENTSPSDTYRDRLAQIIAELKEFDPDIVGISEATITAEHGSAASQIATELGLEPQFAQANPWQAGLSYDNAKQIAEQNGLNRDGVAILVRSNRYPIVAGSWSVHRVNPSWSQNETQVVLRVVVQRLDDGSEIPIYITRLIGQGDERHAAQAEDVAHYIEETRDGQPAIVMGDLNETPGSQAYEMLAATGLVNLTTPQEAGHPLATCCRGGILSNEVLPPLEWQTSYIFGPEGWPVAGLALFGDRPVERADGTWLYPSDHNGVFARIRLPGATVPARD